MNRLQPARRAAGEERGAVLVLVALLMVGMLTIVAIVIDLGQLRSERRETQKSSDLASLAAGYYLAGLGPGEVVSNPREACRAALTSIKANEPGFPSTATLPCDPLPENATVCFNSSPPMAKQTVTAVGAEPFVLTVEYPIPATDPEFQESRFAGGVGAVDGVHQCERMRVSLTSTRDTYFANIVGVGEQTMRSSSVVMGGIEQRSLNVAALLLLDRVNCRSLDTGGQGEVIVESSGPNNPGRIQADSSGRLTSKGGDCTKNSNASGFVIYSSSTGNSRIYVAPTAGGIPGTIGIYALTPGVNGRGGADYNDAENPTTGLNVPPTAGKIASRYPADDRYNNPDPEKPASVRRITALHARAFGATHRGQRAARLAAGYTVIDSTTPGGCNPDGDIPGTRVYVDCATFTANSLTRMPDAHTVEFTGLVSVPNNRALELPVAERVYVRGCSSTWSPNPCGTNVNNSGNYYAMNVVGRLLINTTSHAPCPERTPPPLPEDPDDPYSPLTHRITEVATTGGPMVLNAGGSISMCDTMAYLGRTASTYAPLWNISGTPSGCIPKEPCPATGADAVDTGHVVISGGGSGNVFWTAPNRTSRLELDDSNPFDDLALWAESHKQSDLKGSGSSRTSGIYFLPNSRVDFKGQGNQAQPANAQFISRSLTLSGQGQLRLRPNPADSLSTESPGGYALIR